MKKHGQNPGEQYGVTPKKKSSAWTVFALILLLIQAGSDIFCFSMLKKLNMLPMKYMAVIIVFFLGVLLLTPEVFFGMLAGRKIELYSYHSSSDYEAVYPEGELEPLRLERTSDGRAAVLFKRIFEPKGE